MLKTSLISFGSQPGIVADEVNDEVRGGYSSSGSGRLIKKSAKSKNFKNPKSKNHQIHGRTQLLRPQRSVNFRILRWNSKTYDSTKRIPTESRWETHNTKPLVVV